MPHPLVKYPKQKNVVKILSHNRLYKIICLKPFNLSRTSHGDNLQLYRTVYGVLLDIV